VSDGSSPFQKAAVAAAHAVGSSKAVGQTTCCVHPTPADPVNECSALLEKLRKEAAALADDQGDPIKNGSQVNRRITLAYSKMYQRRPDLHWAGAAIFVSKQMGCNMRWADRSSDPGLFNKTGGWIFNHNVKSLALSSKKVLVRGNQAIFMNIYPQYRLYEESPLCATVYGDNLKLDPRMTDGFKAYAAGNKYDGMIKHADYEQNVILQNQVMDNPQLKQDVRNFQEAQNTNQEWEVRLFRQNQPEQVSFSKDCLRPAARKALTISNLRMGSSQTKSNDGTWLYQYLINTTNSCKEIQAR